MKIMKIFVSYDRRDSEIAHRLTKSIEATGAKVFSVKNIGSAEIWPVVLEKELRASDEMVILLTDKSVQSPNVTFEMGLAAGLRKPIVLVEMGAKPELRSTFGIFEHVRYSNVDGYIQRLSERISRSKSSKDFSNPSRKPS